MFPKTIAIALLKPIKHNNYSYVFKRLAGHSKWANIKHTKGLKDAQRGRMFTKISQQIKVAIQEGGSANPTHNLKLEQVIAQGRRMSMPTATIENVIKSTQKDKTQFKSQLLEIKGPGGCLILCEVFSSNIIKTRNDISSIMKKHMCKYATDSSQYQYMFEHKGIIETKVPEIQGATQDAILEVATNHAIECEAEEVELVEDKLQFFADPRTFVNVLKNLEKLNYEITTAILDYIPNSRVALSDADLEMCGNFYDRLESMDEVVKLYDNIA